MSDLSSKIEMSALSLNSGEGVFIASLLFGICTAMRKCLDNIESYQDMLEDEMDDNPGALAYLEAERENLSRLLAMIGISDEILQSLRGGERVHLTGLVDGILARFNKNRALEDQVMANVDDSLFIRCNPFQVQQMLFDILETYSMSNDGPTKWNVFAKSIVLSQNDLGILNLRNEEHTNFVMLKLSVELEDISLSGNYMLLQDYLGAGMELSISMREATEWLGLAALNNCHILVNRAMPNLGVVVLFPEKQSWENESNDPLNFMSMKKVDNPKTILLVDDEDMIWDVISEMLQDLGYNVILAGDGREAVQIYGGNIGKIDLVIMDMLMPDMGGKEAFYILRGLDPKVKVLISSGYVSEDQIQDVMKDCAAGFLRKPYRMADLAKRIHSILND